MPIYIGGQKVANTNNSVGSIDITTNGTHDVTTRATAVVNVPQGYQVESVLKDDGTQKMVITNYSDVEKPNMTVYFDETSTSAETNLTKLFKIIDISNFNFSNITSMYRMFQGFSNLIEIKGLNKLDTSNVVNMEYMFNGCAQLQNLDLSSFNTINVTDVDEMFKYCPNLTTLKLTSFNLPNITSTNEMFASCSSLKELDLSSFGSAKVQTMYNMFYNCKNLKKVDMTNFDTSKVTNMSFMFYRCEKLVSIIGVFNLENISGYQREFDYCYDLEVLPTFVNLDTPFSLAYSTKLSAEEIETKVLNGLVDLTGQTAKTLTLGTTLLAKLSDQQKAIATNKNWVLA